MKCHYEILEISRDSDDGTIKSAYRKLALKFHPDKNLDNPDLAKEQFQLVQQAYEILSDRQERDWYDAHRDQILCGSSSEFTDKSLNVFQYFTTTCYSGFGDDENGFYTVYRKVFEQIAKEDIEFLEEKEDFIEIPGFGKSDDDYEEVVQCFYDYWMSYSTKKSYSWLDPYDIREGRGDRRLLKIIDKENKKNRQKLRKERNDEVRSLVAFVRKRDKRVQTYKKELEEKVIENRKKQELLSKQKRLERIKQHANEKQADWMKFDNVASGLDEIQKHLDQEFGEALSDSDEEFDDESDFYCIACNKVFKNPKAFENHESSKRHKENIDILRQTMLQEEEELQSNLDDKIVIRNEEDSTEIDQKLTEPLDNLDSSDQEISEHSKKRNKKKKANKNILNVQEHNSDNAEGEDASISKLSDDDFDFGVSKSQKKKNARKATTSKTKQTTTDTSDKIDTQNVEPAATTTKKPARKDRKKDKREISTSDLNEIDTSHCCVTCKGDFVSKNKLFDHLKKTGHGVFIPPKIKQKNKKSNSKREDK